MAERELSKGVGEAARMALAKREEGGRERGRGRREGERDGT